VKESEKREITMPLWYTDLCEGCALGGVV